MRLTPHLLCRWPTPSWLLCLACSGWLALVSVSAEAQRRRTNDADTEAEASATEQPDDPQQVEKLYHEAAIRQAQEVYDEALTLYAEVLKLDPANHAARYNTAWVYLAQQLPDKALPFAEEALKQARKAEEVTFWHYRLVSQCHQALGGYPRALDALEAGIAAFPGQLEARFELAELYIQAQDYGKALALYEELAQRTGLTETIGLQRYRLLLRMGEAKKAVELLRQLIALYPHNRTHYQTLYETYQLLGDPAAAEAVLDEWLALDPASAFALEKRLENLVVTRNWAALQALLLPAMAAPNLPVSTKLALLRRLELVPEPTVQALLRKLEEELAARYPNAPEIQVRLAQAAADAEAYEQARNYALQALQADRTLQAAWNLLLLADDNLLRYDWLMADAYNALQAYPNQPHYNLAYATGARFQEEYSTALRYTERFLLLTEDDGEAAQLYARVLQAEALAEDGADEEARAAWAKALALVADEPITLARYAASLVSMGETDAAAKALTKAARSEPDSPWVRYAQGLLAYANGSFSAAVTAFDAAYALRPSARIAEALGDAHLKAGAPDQARQYWQQAREKGGNTDRLDQKLRAN